MAAKGGRINFSAPLTRPLDPLLVYVCMCEWCVYVSVPLFGTSDAQPMFGGHGGSAADSLVGPECSGLSMVREDETLPAVRTLLLGDIWK